jgi:hypothetical protein
MKYSKSPNQRSLPSEPQYWWGEFTRHLEIGDDGYAIRHVDRFENGYFLRYDRVHWIDTFGMLADFRFKQEDETLVECWGPVLTMTPEEFEQIWQAAESSPVRELQVSTAEMGKHGWGAQPVWLTLKRKGV